MNNNKAEYGKSIMQELSRKLTETYGSGFTKTNLYSYAQFNTYFPINENNTIFHTVCGKSDIAISDEMNPNFNTRLSWSHYRILLQEENKEARDWYANEAAEQMWSVRTLQRNISSTYYRRMLASQQKELVEAEMIEKTKDFQTDKLEYIKNPVVAAKYLPFLPSQEELRHEIETQKEMFYLSQREKKGE